MTEGKAITKDIYKAIFDASPQGIVFFDLKGKVIIANDRLKDWVGYSPDFIVGKNLINLPFLSKKSKLLAAQNLAKRLLGKDVPPYDLSFIHKNKKIGERIGRITASLVKDEKGKIIGDLVMVSDITDEMELEERYESIVQLSPVGIFTTDILGHFTMVNEAGAKILGYPANELLGKHFTKFGFFKLKEIPKFVKLFALAIKGEDLGAIESRYTRKDGTEFIGKSTVVPLKVSGRITGIQTMLEDITSQRESDAKKDSRAFDLERMNKLMVDRELKMVELKKEITSLKKKN